MASVPTATREMPRNRALPCIRGGATPGVRFSASKKLKIANPKPIIAAPVRTQASRVRSSAIRVWIQASWPGGGSGAPATLDQTLQKLPQDLLHRDLDRDDHEDGDQGRQRD